MHDEIDNPGDANPRRSRIRPLGALAAAVMGMTLLIGACSNDSPGSGSSAAESTPSTAATGESTGGDDTSTTTGSAASGDGSGLEAAVAYAQCMRDNGIADYPDPSSVAGGGISLGNPDTDAPGYASADATCKSLLPNNGQPSGGGQSPEQMTAALVKYAGCMRSNGYPDFPDPDGSGDLSLPSGVDVGSDLYQAAQAACEHFLDNAGGVPVGGS